MTKRNSPLSLAMTGTPVRETPSTDHPPETDSFQIGRRYGLEAHQHRHRVEMRGGTGVMGGLPDRMADAVGPVCRPRPNRGA